MDELSSKGETLKAGGSRAAYNTAKRAPDLVIHKVMSEAEKVAIQKIDPLLY